MNCPSCNHADAYVGFAVVECVNDRCRHFNQKLYDTCSRAGVVPVKITVDFGAARRVETAIGQVARFVEERNRDIISEIQQLVKALEAGSYSASPLPESERAHPNELCYDDRLVRGSALQVEDLEAVMSNVSFREEHVVLKGRFVPAHPIEFVKETIYVPKWDPVDED